MTDQQISTPPTPPSPYTSAPAAGQKNVLGIVAFVMSIVGFIFACIPGALIVGWILLPISFILGIVALFFKGKKKWQALTAVIVAVVGTIVGFIVFFAVVATSFNNAFDEVSGGDTVVSETTEEGAATAEDTTEEAPAAEVGTRENPIPLGAQFGNDDWQVTINSVTTNAGDQVAAANTFNSPADPGTEYILINYTVTYTGDDADGQYPAYVSLEYVTAGGVTASPTDKMVVAPDSIDSMNTIYNGGTVTGNEAIQVPSPVDGVLAVRPGMFGDKVFVAVQ